MMVQTPTIDTFDIPNMMSAPMNELASEDVPLPSPQMSPRSFPLPNPPFVFPVRPASSSPPSSFSRATGRRPRSIVVDGQERPSSSQKDEPTQVRTPALPAFSFNPGAALGPPQTLETAFLSPPQSPASPQSPKTAAARPVPHGHRRGGSEFVGGSVRSGDSITVMGTSPTKSESGMASPTLAPSKPRRGHAHRRSAAISSHDLSSIILPPPAPGTLPRGNSAPTSPGLPDPAVPSPSFADATDRPSKSEPNIVPAFEPAPPETNRRTRAATPELHQSPKPIPRNRVGFSDTLEFIPRPLSLVSSDTSSTVTARPGHSLSGSISSVMSAGNLDREMNSPLGPSPRKADEARPSTAGAVLERTQSIHEVEPELPSPRRRGSIPYLGAVPPTDLTAGQPALLSPMRTPKRWSFFGLEPFVSGSPTRSRPVSSSSADSHNRPPAFAIRPDQLVDSPVSEETEKKSKKDGSKKRSKKQKKVKTWAGSILSRKPKSRHGKQKHRSPTPPPPAVSSDDGEDAADTDDYAIEMSSDPEPTMPTLMVTEEELSGLSWKPSRPASVPDEDTSYQMIDLDAALGPFATPLPRNMEWEASQRAGGFNKKQLHSAAGLRGFSGPGGHYHRRAESAPEMVPFEAVRFGFHRFGSNSTMADVFEEDEEDEDSTNKTTGMSTPIAETPAIEQPAALALDAVNVVMEKAGAPSEPFPLADMAADIRRKGSNLSEAEKPQFAPQATSEHSAAASYSEVFVEELPVPRKMWVEDTIGSDASSSAAPSPSQSLRVKDLAPVDVSPLQLPTPSLAPISPYSMSQSSAFPSPRSPMSYDANRISTAPSSITEDNFHSLLMGEPGPEVRISVDDIPSLTSSNSTMTRESILAHNPQARFPPLNDQPRPASFTSTAFGRRRSSLASLSRLISTSHGERSKLSMEVTLDNEPDKKGKVSKTKRFSRMVQFWKPKGSTST